MSRRTLSLAVAAACLTLAGPVLAQDAPVSPPAPAAPAPAQTEAQAAFEAKGEAFEARMEEMAREIETAVEAAGGDQTKLATDLDAVVAKYQPDADAFANELVAFLNSQSASMSPEQQAQVTAMGPVIQAQIKGAPAMARAQALTAAQAASAGEASAPAPTPAPAPAN